MLQGSLSTYFLTALTILLSCCSFSVASSANQAQCKALVTFKHEMVVKYPGRYPDPTQNDFRDEFRNAGLCQVTCKHFSKEVFSTHFTTDCTIKGKIHAAVSIQPFGVEINETTCKCIMTAVIPKLPIGSPAGTSCDVESIEAKIHGMWKQDETNMNHQLRLKNGMTFDYNLRYGTLRRIQVGRGYVTDKGSIKC
ncbi:hypothetical protein BCR37DRAFT_203027 [Protomyces lactucae-debilis]|uniref:Uncharacterized protein n=1 Tax=Protomyces lactucae-debilis TaxID=2754530 RepID=A0A1Y2EST6_PROLT|nr:uncharacterized protein BCR37DRAFT_203027 [Protomyces lactucae-debilis]ORY74623.1 hypothetical protein BCR37DRAFT_203027 [Protomyces lactucae-debilis]